jgi:hypothetical protein
MSESRSDLDPFRVLLSVLVDRGDSDVLLTAVTSGGLRFDQRLSTAQAYSHRTRLRALVPRVINAYDALGESDRLTMARAIVARLAQSDSGGALQSVADALARAGWEVHDGELVVGTPDLREMFFPNGSQWDAFVVLKSIFAEAVAELTVVDAYADHSIFELLSGRPMVGLKVQVLCSKSAVEVAAEAKRFVAQYGGRTVEVRRTKDFHDRFVVLDGATCIHIGASINHAGKTAFMISRLEDDTNRSALLAAIEAAWAAATPVP